MMAVHACTHISVGKICMKAYLQLHTDVTKTNLPNKYMTCIRRPLGK